MRLNNLTGKEWVKLSKSTWITRSLLAWSGRAPLQQSATFLIKKQPYRKKQMSHRLTDETRVKLIELFTRSGQCVFDPCLQQGNSLAAALSVDRQFIGVAENKQQLGEIASLLDSSLRSKPHLLLNQENTDNVLKLIKDKSISFLLTEIPAFNFDDQQADYQQSLADIKKAMESYQQKLRSKGYMALIVADQRYKERYYCRHADIMHVLEDTNLKLQGLINVIKDSQALHAYGYPSTYVPNIVNQFVIIFRLC